MKRRTFLKIATGVSLMGVIPAISAKEKFAPDYLDGTVFHFKPHHQNTGETININDLGRKPIVNQRHEVITISGASNPEYNGEFKSVGFKVSVDKSDDANIVGKVNFISEPFTNELSGLHEVPQRPFKIVAKDKFSKPNIMEEIAKATGVPEKYLRGER